MPSEHADHTATLGFEDRLWAASDLLRGSVDPAVYKHVVLGLLFLRAASDAPIDPDPELFDGGVRVPDEARWSTVRSRAASGTPHAALAAAVAALEQANPALADAVPRDIGAGLDHRTLAALVELVSDLGVGGLEHRATDHLGRVYEYFVGRFASAEGRRGGEFYTPACVVRLLVELLQPDRGTVYDPCCGSGGMFAQSLRFVDAHGGADHRFFGQESNPNTWRMARMNLAVRRVSADLGPRPADTLRHDLHPGLRADFVLANPPFNVSGWGAEALADDPRWAFGLPPPGNGNLAWVQHIVHHLAPGGRAGIVLANGSSSSRGAEGAVRRALVEADLVDAIVALPTQLFYATQIPATVWLLARDRPRRGQVLMVDARSLGRMEGRVHRVLDPEDIARIAAIATSWRAGEGYADAPGLCRSVALADLAAHDHVLTPGRFVGAAPVQAAPEDLAAAAAELRALTAEGHRLDAEIADLLDSFGL